jgi:hypothetical protein
VWLGRGALAVFRKMSAMQCASGLPSCPRHKSRLTYLQDIIHTNLSVREGLELVVSAGMSLPADLIATKVTKELKDLLTK